MHAEAIRSYCLSKPNATESMPFGEDTLVFKVQQRIFLLLDLRDNPPRVNVKCDPEKALVLRERYACVIPGYHMNKKHWNTILCDQSVPESTVLQWINDSYFLVSAGAGKKSH
ncbi:MAG: MmcQ/YjbR family DNA-binding protein [Sphingobacteriia bacterium]|nr:MmcQ/YjbR family DNA-binding protein [Sphingobacteriia bacterium]